MHKKSQLTIFIIIAIVGIILISFAMLRINKNAKNMLKSDYSSSPYGSLAYHYIKDCVDLTLKNSIAYNSLDKEKIRDYILNNLDSCLNLQNEYLRGYDIVTGQKEVIVEITDEIIMITLAYPIELSNQQTSEKINLKDFYLGVPRLDVYEIEQSNGIVTKDYSLTSSEGSFTLLIPKGTKVQDKNGKAVKIDQVTIRIKENEAIDPVSLVGGTKYTIEPHDVYFEPPITIRLKYPINYLENLGQHFTLSYLHPDGYWVDVPTTIDLNNEFLIGEFNYLP